MILITGAYGQLGQAVRDEAAKRCIPFVCTDRDTLDITDAKKTEEYIRCLRPSAVIHCAAYTAVDKAETNMEICRKINTDGTKNVAVASRTADAKMIYISTDYVFDGKKTGYYLPDDETNPLNVYGETKRDGEIAVRDNCDKHFIVRISWLFGGSKGNFVLTMLHLAKTKDKISVVNDQTGSPTYTVDLARLLVDMSESERYGTYHATNEGVCTWFDFAKQAASYTEHKAVFVPLTAKQYGAAAVRPENSRLSKEKLTENGFKRLPTWQDAVERYVKGYLSQDISNA